MATANAAGYSGKPLTQQLGIKPGFRIFAAGAPGPYEKLARALLEYETLTGEEIHKVLRGEKLDRPDTPPPSQLPPTPALPVTDADDVPDPRRRWGQGPDPAPAGA